MKLNENLSDVSASTGFSLWGPGEYAVTIFNTEVALSKAGNRMVKVEFVNENNQHIWDYFVLDNEVGKSRFKGLLVACGHPNPNFIQDTEEIHGKTVTIRVDVETYDYGEKNRIKAYIANKTQQAASPMAKPKQPAVQEPVKPKLKPWELGNATDAF